MPELKRSQERTPVPRATVPRAPLQADPPRAAVEHLLPRQRRRWGLKDYPERSAEGLAEPSCAALTALPFLEGKIPINFSGSRIGPGAQTCSGFPSPYSPLAAGLAREPAAPQEHAEPLRAAWAARAAGARGPAPRRRRSASLHRALPEERSRASDLLREIPYTHFINAALSVRGYLQRANAEAVS